MSEERDWDPGCTSCRIDEGMNGPILLRRCVLHGGSLHGHVYRVGYAAAREQAAVIAASRSFGFPHPDLSEHEEQERTRIVEQIRSLTPEESSDG